MDQSKGPTPIDSTHGTSEYARVRAPSPGPAPNAALWQWLYQEIRAAILDGRLRRGMRVPATRVLARRYGVSPGTVVGAFEQVAAEGYLEGRVGNGTCVAFAPLRTSSRQRLTRQRRPTAAAHPGFRD
jgi:DNA-binding GntR family transcriptional regulator